MREGPSVIWYATLAAVMLLAGSLRIYQIQAESLAGDELFSRTVVVADWPHSYEMIRDDMVHPPLYYWAVKTLLPVTGSGATSIRSVSLLAGLATILVVALLGFWFPDWRWTALAAAGLLACNDSHIYNSQEVRSYALYTLWIALLIAWSWFGARFAPRPSYWASGAVLMTAAMYTHYLAAFFISATIAGTLIGDATRTTKVRTLGVAALAALAFLPWVLIEKTALWQNHGLNANLAWQGTATLADLKTLLARQFGLPSFRGATTLSLLIGFGLLAYAVTLPWRTRPRRRHAIAVLTCAGILPPVLLFVLASKPIGLPLFADRQVLPSIVPLLLLASAGAVALGRRSRVLSAFALVALFAMQLVPTLQNEAHAPRRMPYRELAADLQTDPELRSIPVYTTWARGLGKVLDFYLGSHRVRALPLNPAELPPVYAVLYRPEMQSEDRDLARVVNLNAPGVERKYSMPTREEALGVAVLIVHRRYN